MLVCSAPSKPPVKALSSALAIESVYLLPKRLMYNEPYVRTEQCGPLIRPQCLAADTTSHAPWESCHAGNISIATNQRQHQCGPPLVPGVRNLSHETSQPRLCVRRESWDGTRTMGPDMRSPTQPTTPAPMSAPFGTLPLEKIRLPLGITS